MIHTYPGTSYLLSMLRKARSSIQTAGKRTCKDRAKSLLCVHHMYVWHAELLFSFQFSSTESSRLSPMGRARFVHCSARCKASSWENKIHSGVGSLTSISCPT